MPTYHIDPQHGSDKHDGLSGERAWRSFAPLAALELTSGDTVAVLCPGTLTHTLALRGGGSAEQPIRVHFAPGRYDIEPACLEAKCFHISNCNAAADDAKKMAMWFDRVSHVKVEGHGTVMVCRGKMIEMCFDHASDIEVHGITFDYHRPTVSECTVIEASQDEAIIEIHPDSTYELSNRSINWLGEGWSYTTGLAQELIPETHSMWRRKDPLADMHLKEISPGRLRVTGEHDMTTGRVYQLRDTFRDCVGVFMNRSSDIRLDKVYLAFMHGMGVLCQYTTNITLRGVRIAPLEGSGRTSAAWADAMHFSGCRGDLVVEDCFFSGAHDDAINVHGTYLQIQDQPDPNQITVAFKHRQTYGFQAYDVGDEIGFVRSGSLQCYAKACVTGVEMLDRYQQRLTLDTLVPAWQQGDVIENLTWAPRVTIRDCQVERIPTRGFLLSSPKTIVVEDCTFTRMVHGIHAEGEAEQWFESGSVRDMTIRRNRFIESRKAGLRIGPHRDRVSQTISENVRIEQNTFILLPGTHAVDILGVNGVTILNNTIQATCSPQDSDDSTCADPYKLTDCEDVKVDGQPRV